MRKLLAILLFLPALAWGQGVLTGTDPGDTYGGLIHFDGNLGAPAAVPAVVYDGLGNALPMSASQTTISFTGVFTMTQVNAASGSANPFDYTGTLGIMNGSDDFTLFDVNMTNANHTGTNTVQILDIAAITGDAEATETAINIGAGWDSGLTSLSTVKLDGGFSVDTPAFVVADTTGALTTTGAAALNGGISVDTPAFVVADTTGAISSTGLATLTGGLTLGADDDASNLIIHDASTIQMYDDSDDSSVTFGPVVDGTTYIDMTGGFDGLDLGDDAVGSVLTFAGADALGSWKLIDFSGAGGISDASDYFLYRSANDNWAASNSGGITVSGSVTSVAGKFSAATNGSTLKTLDLAADAAASVLTFAGADAAGNWKLIDTSGAGGMNDASDYYFYDDTATDFWRGDGVIQAGGSRALLGKCDTETVADTGDGSPATDTYDPTALVNCKLYTCSDVHSCDITMAEATAYAGQILMITSTGANAVDFADQAGILNINGGAVALVTDDTLTLMYTGTQWLEISRSDN